MPAISVLMPVYNAERFLAEAIDSILNQTFTDFEFLIIDDGSSDNSIKIVESYNDPRIRFYQNQHNLGISATLNKGISLSSAEWIARMDSDDISYPKRLQKQYDFILEHPDGALYSSWVREIGQQGQFIREDKFKCNYYYYNLTFTCWIYHPIVIFNKRAVEEVGMYTVPFSEDFELFWQISRKHKIYHLPETLLDYRITDQSLHQVLKKDEYTKAQRNQLLRNFQYYAGDGYSIPETVIDFMQHNFDTFLKQRKVNSIVACVHELDFITRCILDKENINRDAESIERAAFFKRKFILEFFADNLPFPNGILLLVKLRAFSLLNRRLKNNIKKFFGIKNKSNLVSAT